LTYDEEIIVDYRESSDSDYHKSLQNKKDSESHQTKISEHQIDEDH
jgi:hypothetical protein